MMSSSDNDYTDGILSRDFKKETKLTQDNNYGYLADATASSFSAILFIAGSYIFIIRTEYKSNRNAILKRHLVTRMTYFVVYRLIASIGWKFALEYYTSKTILSKVYLKIVDMTYLNSLLMNFFISKMTKGSYSITMFSFITMSYC
jgi:hypothetical protein